MMQALIKEDPVEGYTLKKVPIPVPKNDEIVFKVEKVIPHLNFYFSSALHPHICELYR
jgi:hypothetical protein